MFVMVRISNLRQIGALKLKYWISYWLGISSQVKLNPSLLEDIIDDLDFCLKLAKEDSVIVLPGM